MAEKMQEEDRVARRLVQAEPEELHEETSMQLFLPDCNEETKADSGDDNWLTEVPF